MIESQMGAMRAGTQAGTRDAMLAERSGYLLDLRLRLLVHARRHQP